MGRCRTGGGQRQPGHTGNGAGRDGDATSKMRRMWRERLLIEADLTFRPARGRGGMMRVELLLVDLRLMLMSMRMVGRS